METKVNFTALEQNDLLNVKRAFLNRITDWLPHPYRTIVLIALVIVLIPLVMALPLVLLLVVGIVTGTNPVAGLALMFLIFLGMLKLRKRQKRIDNKARVGLSDFARQNGWKYGPVGKLIEDFNGARFIKSAKENNITLYSLKGQIKNRDFELLIGWKATKNETMTPLSPELFVASHKTLPNAVLMSRGSTDGSKVFDKMFVSYKDPSAISLEGDFDKYFQLYVPRGEQTNALSLIAPDFMQSVIAFSNKLTIETSGNCFALFPAYAGSLTKQTIIDTFTAAEKILAETDY